MTIGENIKRIRLEKGMSRREVAEACGTVSQTIRTYESDKANPKPQTVAKLAMAMKVSPAEIYGVPGNKDLDNSYAPDVAAAIYHALMAENEHQTQEFEALTKNLADTFNKLNPAGQKELITRAQEMASLEKFAKPADKHKTLQADTTQIKPSEVMVVNKPEWVYEGTDGRRRNCYTLRFCDQAYIELAIPTDKRYQTRMAIVNTLHQRTDAEFVIPWPKTDDIQVIQNEAVKLAMKYFHSQTTTYADMTTAINHAMLALQTGEV